MIFAARGLLVSLAFFTVVYCFLSALVALAWWAALPIRESLLARSSGLLFGLRIFSFIVSGVIALCFAFPSFWIMERASLDEDAGTFVLAACALIILSAGIFRVLRDQSRTAHALRKWWVQPSSAQGNEPKPSLGAAKGAPALILAGIRRPQIMISDAAVSVLSDDELKVAVRHELAHRRSCDNLKKALISATPFPGMTSLEKAWRDAAELAADDGAVGNRQDALDLAAALIKLSRSRPSPEPALASGLVCATSSIAMRVERLLEWRAAGHRLHRSWPWNLALFLTLAAVIASHYGATLVLTHRLTELLVP